MLHTLVRERLLRACETNGIFLFLPRIKTSLARGGRDTRDTRMARPFVLAFIGLKKRKSVMRVQRGNVIIFFIFETRCGLTMLFCTANLTKFLTSLIQVF